MDHRYRGTIATLFRSGACAGGGCRALLALLLLGLGGCGRTGGVGAENQKPGTAHTQAERGPVRVDVVADPSPARLSDLVKLTLTIEYEHGVTVRKPAFGAALGDFVVRDFREPMLRAQGNRDVIQQVYTLEPLRTGKIPVLPITVAFTDSRPQGDGQEHTLETEGLSVEIASVTADEVPSLDSLRPAAEPVELPHSAWSVLAWGAGGMLVAGMAGLVWWLRRRREAAVLVTVLSPRELAYLELQRLLESGLAQSDVKLYYVELTAVVRRYIERTTGIRAPEQTTQEFLCEIGRQSILGGDEGRRLRDFLESADLVKFAAYHPRREDIEESFRRAQAFVGFDVSEKAA